MDEEESADGLGPIVAEIDRCLQLIRRLQTKPIADDQRRMGLTMPQVKTLEELFKEDGLSLNVLSRRLDLSHSTVSGIVERLERRGLVERRAGSADRRYTHIFLAARAHTYAQTAFRQRLLGPLVQALQRATPAERETVRAGLTTLVRLLGADAANFTE